MTNAKQPSIAIRIAALMDREKIDSLPRNYELVYDAYSGSNPELTREFMAIQGPKTQKALDEIGRKYLPHHHEEGLLAKTGETMQSQMFDFLQLIQNEMSSLAEFETAIGEANRAMSSEKGIDRAAFAKSIDKLSKATAQQAKNNKALGDAAAAQNSAMEELKKEMDELEARKWTDPATGLANRRSFNKTIVGIFANPDRPIPRGLAIAELDDFQNYGVSGENRFSNQVLLGIANQFRSANASRQFIAYLDKGRFAIVLNTEDPDQISGFVEGLRTAMKAKGRMVTKRNSKVAEITLSFGVSLASEAVSAGEFLERAEKALSESVRAGGDRVTFNMLGEPPEDRKNWMLYASG